MKKPVYKRIYVTKIGFPVESKFSANGMTKLEYHNIKVEANSIFDAELRLLKGYGSDIIIVSTKFYKEI